MGGGRARRPRWLRAGGGKAAPRQGVPGRGPGGTAGPLRPLRRRQRPPRGAPRPGTGCGSELRLWGLRARGKRAASPCAPGSVARVTSLRCVRSAFALPFSCFFRSLCRSAALSALVLPLCAAPRVDMRRACRGDPPGPREQPSASHANDRVRTPPLQGAEAASCNGRAKAPRQPPLSRPKAEPRALYAH